ncbi:hypothetical protein MPLSOD_41113 [Mesorhizobium sp. SOD10]|nr:hypothetical protein MPLSOD_41113 [Mesorhizobium sp. SOD10]
MSAALSQRPRRPQRPSPRRRQPLPRPRRQTARRRQRLPTASPPLRTAKPAASRPRRPVRRPARNNRRSRQMPSRCRASARRCRSHWIRLRCARRCLSGRNSGRKTVSHFSWDCSRRPVPQTTGNGSGRFFLVIVFIRVAIFILVVGLIVARGLGFLVGFIVFIVVIFVLVFRLIVGRGSGVFVVFGRIGGFDRRGGSVVEDVLGNGFDGLGGGRGPFDQIDIVNGIHGMPPWFGNVFCLMHVVARNRCTLRGDMHWFSHVEVIAV